MANSRLGAWASAVKSRDGKCLDCGSVDDLHAHHIKPKSAYPELIFDVSNGRTLCYRCHKAEHERNRPVRVRSNQPQRRTLKRQIEQLSEELSLARNRIRELSKFKSTPEVTREQLGRLLNHDPELLERVRASILRTTAQRSL